MREDQRRFDPGAPVVRVGLEAGQQRGRVACGQRFECGAEGFDAARAEPGAPVGLGGGRPR
jgi:hypothetical protein